MRDSIFLPEGALAPFIEPGSELTREVLEEQEKHFFEVLQSIMERAESCGVTIRTLGSIAFRIKCPDYKYMEYQNGRYLTDIDFVAYSKEIPRIQDMFLDMGWEENQTVLRLFGHKRRIFYHPELPLHSDVFLDKLRFCHEIDFRKRLEIDKPTVSVTDLLLGKLQIVEINKKDIIDIMILLRQYGVSDGGTRTNCLDGEYISRLFCRNWGWWKTGTCNLDKTGNFSSDYLSEEDAADVRSKLSQIRSMIADRGKSLSWKSRSLIGEKIKWYDEVEEVERE